ncbi:hypothetical protein NSTCB13_05254 [Nostoc sp. DSM 114160]|jgi:CheY-like chemotaxis protein
MNIHNSPDAEHQGDTMTKILVIEDEPESRDIFLDSLEAEGFEAIASSGQIAGRMNLNLLTP